MYRIASLALAVCILAEPLPAQQNPAAGSPEEAVARTIQLLEQERWEDAASMADPIGTEQLLLQARCEIYNNRRMAENRSDPVRSAQIAMLFGPAAQRQYLQDNFAVDTLEELESLTPMEALTRYLSLGEIRSQKFEDELRLAIAAMSAAPEMSARSDSMLAAINATRPPDPAPEVIGHVARGDTAFVVMLPGNPMSRPQIERVYRRQDGWRLALDGPVFEAPVYSSEFLCPEVGVR